MIQHASVEVCTIFFLHTARKVRTVRPADEKQPTHFTLLMEKISICTTGVSKESLSSHICHPRHRLGRQLYAIWDILTYTYTFTPYRCIIYYLSEGRKMNFRVPYGSREILNVLHYPKCITLHCFTLSISRPLYGPRKVILRSEDKRIMFLFAIMSREY